MAEKLAEAEVLSYQKIKDLARINSSCSTEYNADRKIIVNGNAGHY